MSLLQIYQWVCKWKKCENRLTFGEVMGKSLVSCFFETQCIHRFEKKFSGRLSNKPFLIWSLTTPPHLKYVAKLPCNLSLIVCFLTLLFHKVVWQHTVYARNDGIFNNRFTVNLLENQPVKEFSQSVKIWQWDNHEYGVSVLWNSMQTVEILISVIGRTRRYWNGGIKRPL